MLIFSERQLYHVLAQHEAHYNTHRPHRALDQRSATARIPAPLPGSEIVVRRVEILGGLINEYRSAA
jgi:putative transposase